MQLVTDKTAELARLADEQDSEGHRQLLRDRVERSKRQHTR
jgi:hypothetical protein